MINEKVYKKLIEVAKRQGKYEKGIITYSDLNYDCQLGIVFEGDAGGKEIGKILGEISEIEFKNKRPLISVVVIRKNLKPLMASHGFFNLAEELGLKSTNEDNQLFFAKELGRVHDYWKNG